MMHIELRKYPIKNRMHLTLAAKQAIKCAKFAQINAIFFDSMLALCIQRMLIIK